MADPIFDALNELVKAMWQQYLGPDKGELSRRLIVAFTEADRLLRQQQSRVALEAQPPAAAPASDGEREELAQELETVAEHFDQGTPEERALERAAALLRQPAPAPAAVPVPENADQAALMVLLGHQWLAHNAPERLRTPAPAAVPVARPAPTPDDFRRWWRETGAASPAPSPEMLLTANAWAEAWAALRQPVPSPVARPAYEWHEDMGDVQWWRFPVEEPPYCGSPLDTDWPGYHTHFTPLAIPQLPHAADQHPAAGRMCWRKP